MSDDATERLSRKVYDHLRRRTMRSIGLTEEQIDELHADVARAIKKDLKALVRYTDRDVERALRKHYNRAFGQKREKLVAEQIERSAEDGADAGFETFRRLYGDDASPLPEKSSSPRRRHLRLLRPQEFEDE